jgi:DNA repair protein RecN (Recombination protein N)
MLMHQEQIIAAFNEALAAVDGEDTAPGVLDRLRTAQARLDRVAEKAGGALQPTLEALERAMIETEEAVSGLQAFGSRLEAEPDRMERVDDRLHALRAAARKYDVAADDLLALADRLRGELAEVEDRGEAVARLEAEVARTRGAFVAACRELSKERKAAAKDLAARVMEELPALKLERAVFAVALEPRGEEAWTADGAEDVRFMAATNPGTPPGPLNRIASGGELSRFMLALNVVLAAGSPVGTLVFDEVDSGVGGATAAAVGERLAQLAESVQVLVVTHSPQVAARGDQHWRVLKREAKGTVITTVEMLDGDARLEEVARMLSGAEITAEARGAAARLLEAAA